MTFHQNCRKVGLKEVQGRNTRKKSMKKNYEQHVQKQVLYVFEYYCL